MKLRKLTFGAFAALALAVNAGCQSMSTQAIPTAPAAAEKVGDHLDVTYYRVQLADPLQKDIDWSLVNKALSGEGATVFDDAYWKAWVSRTDKPTDKIVMMGRSALGDSLRHDVDLAHDITPQMLEAELAKQGKVSQVMASSMLNALDPGATDGKIRRRHQQTVAFVPKEQCAADGSKVDASKAKALSPGYWLTQINFAFTPMRKVKDRAMFEFSSETISEGKVPDCDYISKELTSTGEGKSSTLNAQGLMVKNGHSFLLSGIRENGIDRSLEYSEAGKGSGKSNEVLVLLMKPSLQ